MLYFEESLLNERAKEKLCDFQKKINEKVKGFKVIDLYATSCPNGHTVYKYLKDFLSSPICPICNFMQNLYIFKLLNERGIKYRVVQNPNITGHRNYNGTKGLLQVEVYIYINNKVHGSIYFITSSNKDSVKINRTLYSKLFDHKKVDNVEYCNEFLNKFLENNTD